MEITFRPLVEADIDLVLGWRSRPHVYRWFGGELPSPATRERIAGSLTRRIRGEEPVHCFVAQFDGADAGFVQGYRASDVPAHAAKVGGGPETASLDVFIGEESFLHRGLGSALVRRFVEDIVLADPTITRVVVDTAVGNRSAIAAYARAGFRPAGSVTGHDAQPELLMEFTP